MSEPVVLVLAGGASNRFWPLRDKPLLRFGARTLLGRHLESLRSLAIERFVVVCRPDAVAQVADAVLAGGLPWSRTVVQTEARGMADAVLRAAPELEALGDSPLYVTQAQDVVDADLHASVLSTAGANESAFAVLAAQRVSEHFPGGYLSLAGGRIESVVEKPASGEEPSDLVTLVAHYFRSWRPLVARLQATDDGDSDDRYERALASLMREKEFRPAVYEGRWQALKYPWQPLDVIDMLLERWLSGRESPGEGYTTSEGGVVLGTGVRVFPGAHVVGPALVGHGAVIGHNALVRGSVVGDRAVIGFGSEVARSYVGEGVELHHNYVGDSVLDRGSSMGFGTTTANYRLDGRTVPSMVGGRRVDSGREKLGLVLGAGAKVGVNTSTMPGVKIGAGAIIGPNLRITKDVPDGERVLNDGEYGRL